MRIQFRREQDKWQPGCQTRCVRLISCGTNEEFMFGRLLPLALTTDQCPVWRSTGLDLPFSAQHTFQERSLISRCGRLLALTILGKFRDSARDSRSVHRSHDALEPSPPLKISRNPCFGNISFDQHRKGSQKAKGRFFAPPSSYFYVKAYLWSNPRLTSISFHEMRVVGFIHFPSSLTKLT